MTLFTHPTRLLSRCLTLAALVVASYSASAQSPLAVAPGEGSLNAAIDGDTDRPDDRVYVLERGGDYPLTAVIKNDGYTLRIQAAEGDGVRPVIRPVGDLGSRFLDFGGDTFLTGVFVLGVGTDGEQKGIPIRVNGSGQRLVIDECVFEGGNSRFMEVTAPGTKLRITDSQFRNFVRPDNVSNGRAIDYRDVPADSLFIQNNSFLNVTGFVVRFGVNSASTALEHFIFDHNTVHTTSNDLIDSGVGRRAIEYTLTNNLFVNVNGPGQSEPTGDPDGFIKVTEFDGSGFGESDRQIRISNNSAFASPELLAYYQERADAGDPLVPYQLIHPSSQDFIDGSAQATAANNITEAVTFDAPPRLDSYIEFLRAVRTFQPAPFWAIGSDDALFPVEQPLPEDLGYAETETALGAAERGFPLGDLNWFSDALKAQFEEGGTVASENGPGPDAGFAIRGTYPNPTAGDVTVVMDLDAASEITVTVFDRLGRQVLALPSTGVAAGTRQPVVFDASALPSGLYLIRVTAQSGGASRSQARRFTVVR